MKTVRAVVWFNAGLAILQILGAVVAHVLHNPALESWCLIWAILSGVIAWTLSGLGKYV